MTAIDIHLVRDICSDATCPYCELPITDEPGEDFGGRRMHKECYANLGVDMGELDKPKPKKKRLWKTITWSLTAFMITTAVGWWLTGDIMKGGAIGMLCRGIKIPVYYWHDLLWDWWQGG